MLRCQVLLFLFIYVKNSFAIYAVYDTGKELVKLYSMLDEIKLSTTQGIHTDDGAHELLTASNQITLEIKNQMEIIYEQLSQLDANNQPKIIQHSFLHLRYNVTLYKCIDEIEIYSSAIDKYYEEFHKCINGSISFTNCLQGVSIQTLVQNVEEYIVMMRLRVIGPNEFLSHDQNLVEAITDYANTQFEQVCSLPDPISNGLFKLFKILMIAEIKSNVILFYGNIYRYPQNEDGSHLVISICIFVCFGIGWKIINPLDKGQFQRYFATYSNIFGMNMNTADRLYMRACDPDTNIWIRDKSFHELKKTFQATIFRYHWAACKHNSCNSVWFEKAYQCSPTIYDTRSSCSGTVAECTYLGAIEACILKADHNKFKYVDSSKLGLLGNNSICPKENGYKIIDGVGWNFTHAACTCNCYRNYNKISLDITESDVTSNRVITGLKFIRKNQILYIQLRTGKLGAKGRILRRTNRWEQVPNFHGTSQVHWINKQNRVFFFDDLRLPPGFVLTGVKFNKVTRGTVEGFAIQIFGVPYDYKSGNFSVGNENRISKQNSNADSGEPLSFIPKSSHRTLFRHEPTHGAGYVSLERSTLQSNFGQSTLPFFDGVPITTESSALGGIGIFHKGIEGYAGFISLRVYGIVNAKYFSDFELSHVKNDKVIFD